nr:hypothetical protein [Pseudomonas saponiphila]
MTEISGVPAYIPHLRLVYYAAKEGMPQSRDFEQWLQQEPALV